MFLSVFVKGVSTVVITLVMYAIFLGSDSPYELLYLFNGIIFVAFLLFLINCWIISMNFTKERYLWWLFFSIAPGLLGIYHLSQYPFYSIWARMFDLTIPLYIVITQSFYLVYFLIQLYWLSVRGLFKDV